MGRVVRTADGRTLAVEESGDLAGRPVLVHMGTPTPGSFMAAMWPMRPTGVCG